MSPYDYHASRGLRAANAPFAALIMAAYARADTTNGALLKAAFPEITHEMHRRYDAPGGLLPGEEDIDAAAIADVVTAYAAKGTP